MATAQKKNRKNNRKADDMNKQNIFLNKYSLKNQ